MKQVLSAVLLPVILGVVAGATKAFFKTNLQLPGHSVLWWFAPILAAKLLCGRRWSATTASIAAGAVLALWSHGTGRLVGPLEFAASGLATDLLGTVFTLGARSAAVCVPAAMVVGVVANLSRLAVKTALFALPAKQQWLPGLGGLAWRGVSYALFGAVTGLLVVIAFLISRAGRKGQRRRHPSSEGG